MEYYAKSKKVQFTSERINEIKKNMKNIEECLKENLTETDIEILNSSITDIAEKTEEKQKTLKEHHKDIVTCAEMFFLEYGEYFTEKEKKLVVEACRIHDLGKVNLVFQAMICPKLAEKFHIDVRKTSQIPHGFLSAVTISLDEFDDLSELFSDKDFGKSAFDQLISRAAAGSSSVTRVPPIGLARSTFTSAPMRAARSAMIERPTCCPLRASTTSLSMPTPSSTMLTLRSSLFWIVTVTLVA